MKNQIVKHYAGSIAYGTNLPTSDVDFRGIYCDDPSGIVTPWSKPRSTEWEDPTEEDTKLYELYNYLKLYVDGSPNILESLWVDESDIIQKTDVYDYLRDNASALLSRKLRYTFGGYALGQMKRIKGHNKWINNPQSESRPSQSDYVKLVQNLTDNKVYAKDFHLKHCNGHHMLVPYGNYIYGVLYVRGSRTLKDDGTINIADYKSLPDELKKQQPRFLVKFLSEEFKRDTDTWKNYWKWKRERNEKRSELEEVHGYDTKHAMHIVRLLRMGEEVLSEGVIKVKRPDAEELLDIRAGKWTYDELLEWSEYQDDKLNSLMKTSCLPKVPDVKLAEKVLITAEEMVCSK